MNSTPSGSPPRFSVRGLDYTTLDMIKALAFRYRVTQGEVVAQAVFQIWQASEADRLADNAVYDDIRADWPPLWGKRSAPASSSGTSKAAKRAARDGTR